MNKEDLIKKYEGLEGVWDANGAEIARQCFLRDLEQLNEIVTKKVTVPQYVADWIEYCKNTFLSLVRALMVNEIDFYNYANQKDHSRLVYFLGSGINQEIFARAWLDGYEVEQEKRYLVKVKGVSRYGRYLNKVLSTGEYFFASENELGLYKTKHTKEELENSGFGWVFDCPGVEVEEVEG